MGLGRRLSLDFIILKMIALVLLGLTRFLTKRSPGAILVHAPPPSPRLASALRGVGWFLAHSWLPDRRVRELVARDTTVMTTVLRSICFGDFGAHYIAL